MQTAEADLELAKLKLESTRVTSPIVGKISGSVLTAGNIAVADTTVLATILSFDPIYAVFDADQNTMMRLNRLIRDLKIKADSTSGYPVLVYLNDGDGFKHPAKADIGDNVVDVASGTVRCRAVLPNPDGFLMPGLFVRVKLITSAPRRAYVFPMQAEVVLDRRDSKLLAYVVNSENVVEAREVQYYGLLDGLHVFDAGLRADEWVVIDRFDRPLVGKKVEPVKVTFPFPGKPAEDKPATP